MNILVENSLNAFPVAQTLSPTLNVLCMDSHVEKIYGEAMELFLKSFLAKGARLEKLVFPAGEASKSREQKEKLEEALFEMGANRQTKLFALGGGVTGDLIGFVAATFMRGLAYINIPTTTLAMVDSSVGGKTGINTKYGKNTLGAFWPAEAVWVHPPFLETLPSQEFLGGYMEAFKVFALFDPEALEIPLENSALWVERALLLKQALVEKDFREKGARVLLNFGHTIGHALELLEGYRGHHGHAVAWGMLAEAWILREMGVLEEESFEKLALRLKKFPLEKSFQALFLRVEELVQATKGDKKNKDENIHIVALEALGRASENLTLAMSEEILHNSLERFAPFSQSFYV